MTSFLCETAVCCASANIRHMFARNCDGGPSSGVIGIEGACAGVEARGLVEDLVVADWRDDRVDTRPGIVS